MKDQGFDFSVNLLRALIWRFDSAPQLRAIAEAKQSWYDRNQTEFWSNWFRDVFNPDTLNDFGCAVWGRILDIQMNVEDGRPITKNIFGFGSFYANFNNGPFAKGKAELTKLSVQQKRLMIKLRYFQLTTRATIPEINQFMSLLFGELGKAVAWDNRDMTITYFFEFVPSPSLRYILEQYDLLPRPEGVEAFWRQLPRRRFGFGPRFANFNNGTFGATTNAQAI